MLRFIGIGLVCFASIVAVAGVTGLVGEIGFERVPSSSIAELVEKDLAAMEGGEFVIEAVEFDRETGVTAYRLNFIKGAIQASGSK